MFKRCESTARSDQADTVLLTRGGITTNPVITQAIANPDAYSVSRRSMLSISSVRNTGGNKPTKNPQQPIMTAINSLLVKLSMDDIHHRLPALPATPTSSQTWR